MNPNFRWTPGVSLATETERFNIESLNPDSVNDSYLGWWNDPKVQDGLNMPPRGWSMTEAKRHVRKFDNRTSWHLGITDKASGRLIGFFALFWMPQVRIARSNIVIGEQDFWGKRVVTEVRHHMMSFIFEELNAVKLKGEIMGRNLPSIFNYQEQGFTNEGVLRAELIKYDGSGRVDKYLFGLLKTEWLAKQKK